MVLLPDPGTKAPNNNTFIRGVVCKMFDKKKIGSLGDQNRRRDLFMAPKPSPALSRAPTVVFYI